MNLELQGKAVLVTGGSRGIGLGALTKAMGKGSPAFGVRVPGVHPPATRTDRIVPLMIEPEQVADAVVFLASPRAGRLSGVVLNLGA